MDGTTKTKQDYKDEAYKHARHLIDNGYVIDTPLEALAKKIYRKKKEIRRSP